MGFRLEIRLCCDRIPTVGSHWEELNYSGVSHALLWSKVPTVRLEVLLEPVKSYDDNNNVDEGHIRNEW